MKKKTLAIVMALFMAAGLLSGCGGSSTNSSTAASADSTAPADSTATPADSTASADSTAAPADSTASADSTAAPVDSTASADSTAAPADSTAAPASGEKTDIYVFIAASLSNSMEEIKAMYEKDHTDVNIIYNADSSGTLQTQIEEGAACDLFFSAATKQMDALTEGGYIMDGSVKNLLQNKVVLIKAKGAETKVTGFDNITDAANLALAGEDVPVGQYAREVFTNMGITDQVMAMEINEGANVTAVLTAVAEKSNEVGVVYATDAASMPDDVEVIAEAPADALKTPVIYPVGLVENKEASTEESAAAAAFEDYLSTDAAMQVFTTAGFSDGAAS